MRPAQTTRTAGTRSTVASAVLERRPAPSAAPAGRPSRGSRCRRRRGRSGGAPAIQLALSGAAVPRLPYSIREQPRDHPGLRATTPTSCRASSAATPATTTSARRRRGQDAKHQAHDVLAAGGQVALFVHRVRAARRRRLHGLPQAPRDGAHGPPRGRRPLGATSSPTPTGLRPAMAKGKYDAFLLMPRGVRDEEFHNAITDLLSDWGSTVADARGGVGHDRLARRATSLTLQHPRLPRPDGHAEPGLPPRHRGGPRRPRPLRRRAGPVTRSCSRRVDRSRSCRDQRPRRRGRRSTARPDDIDVDQSSTWRSSAPARPVSPPRCTPPPRASPP